VGPYVSDGRGSEGILLRRGVKMAHGPLLDPGQILAPGPFSPFLISFFLFCFHLNFGLKLLQNLYFEFWPTFEFCKSFPLLSEHTGKVLIQEQSKTIKKMQVHGEGMHELMHDFMCKFYKKNSQKLGCYNSLKEKEC
jgi:hypothetical protein